MFDLLPDGTIAIDFAPSEGPPVRVVVQAPPTVGALKRLRKKANEIDAEAFAYAEGLDADLTEEQIESGQQPLTPQERRRLVQERNDESAILWWTFVMIGDDTWKGLAPDAPSDTDDWPAYMATIEAMMLAQQHWRTTPLARGGKLVQATS